MDFVTIAIVAFIALTFLACIIAALLPKECPDPDVTLNTDAEIIPHPDWIIELQDEIERRGYEIQRLRADVNRLHDQILEMGDGRKQLIALVQFQASVILQLKKAIESTKSPSEN